MSNFINFRNRWIYNQVKNNISAQDTVLDFGCGTGRAGAYIKRKIGCDIIGIDVTNYFVSEIKRIIYNGATLPFPKGKFSISQALFVLHHIEKNQQANILKELARVTTKRIIVIEDYFQPTFSRWWLYLIELVCNRMYFAKVPIPYAFRTAQEWKELFESIGLIVSSEKIIKSPTPFLKHIVFMLEKYTDPVTILTDKKDAS